MKVIIEKNIPYINGVLEQYAQEVLYLPNEEITPEVVADAEVLLVRTRTKCNESLLKGSKVKFIGTCTIGTDHIDLEYCKQNGITVCNAPGCNAPAVAQYVFATIGQWMKKECISSTGGLTLGIIGVGHVGSIIARWARQLGFKVLLNDPPLHRATGSSDYVPLSKLKSDADIITIHTPLVKTGVDSTVHLVDMYFINALQNCRLLINSSRGSVVDNKVLLENMDDSSLTDIAIDCWENEPDINDELLRRAFVATPHIAGYSSQGKLRATAMILEELNKHFGWQLPIPEIDTPLKGALNVNLDKIMDSYNPLDDTQVLKNSKNTFELQRNHYALRQEVK